MPAKIKLIRAMEYLQASPEGDLDLAKSKEMLIDVASAKHPLADFNFVLDFRRVQLKLTAADIYFLAAELPKYADTLSDKIAILALPGTNFEKSEFLELCSRNRGFNIDCFSNYEDAVEWLFGD